MMEDQRFDRIARSLIASPSRRRFLGGVVAAPGLIALWDASTIAVEAKKKKKRKQKLKRNEFGCVDVGQPCRGNDANCCSGQCDGPAPKKGKKDTSACVAHHEDECQAGDDACLIGQTPCGVEGSCFRTTGNASFCGKPIEAECEPCSTDADCAGFGTGAACIVCVLNCDKSGGTACVPPAASVP